MIKIKVKKVKYGYTGEIYSTDSSVVMNTGITRLDSVNVYFDLFWMVNDIKYNDPELEFEYDTALLAFNIGITDIGQLLDEQKNELRKFERIGLLKKVSDYQFPAVKTKYIANLVQ